MNSQSIAPISGPIFCLVALVAAGWAPSPLLAQGNDPCGVWVTSPVPGMLGTQMVDASVVGPDLAFAVGAGFEGAPFELPLMWRLDSNGWRLLPGPSVPGPFGYGAPLLGVEALSATEVWAIGRQTLEVFFPFQCIVFLPRILRWNGATWTELPSFQLAPGALCDRRELIDLEAIGSELWFVGRGAPVGGCGEALALHWTGAAMEYTPLPCAGLPSGSSGYQLNAVAAVASNDVWAVGGGASAFDPAAALIPNPGYIAHWDGLAWSHVPHQAPGQKHRLLSVDAYASNDVWALGEYLDNGVLGSFATHWDGSSWTPMVVPGGTRGLVVQNPHSIHAVGDGIYYYAGQSWTQVEAFPGSVPANQFLTLEDIEPIGPCEFLVVGRTATASGFSALPFAARLEPISNSVEPLGGCIGGVLAGSLQAVQPPQLGGTLVLAMDDTSGLGALISGASVPFLFLSTASLGIPPCGFPLPGFGPGGQTGELLIDLSQLALNVPVGSGPWTGPGTPSLLNFNLTDMPGFAGLSFYAQGLWVTPSPSLTLLFSNGLKLTLGY